MVLLTNLRLKKSRDYKISCAAAGHAKKIAGLTSGDFFCVGACVGLLFGCGGCVCLGQSVVSFCCGRLCCYTRQMSRPTCTRGATSAGQKPRAARGRVPERLGTQKWRAGATRCPRGDAGAKRTPTEGETSLGARRERKGG